MKLSSITEWPSTYHAKLNKNEMFDVSYVDSVVALDSIQLHGDIKVLWQRVHCIVLADLAIGQLDVDYNYLWIYVSSISLKNPVRECCTCHGCCGK